MQIAKLKAALEEKQKLAAVRAAQMAELKSALPAAQAMQIGELKAALAEQQTRMAAKEAQIAVLTLEAAVSPEVAAHTL
jgi:uncharacterized coiled-coil protein SlyX